MAARARRFIVLGSGGHGRVVADLVRTAGFDVVAFADADDRKLGKAVDGLGTRVLLSQEELLACAFGDRPWPRFANAMALGIGDNARRAAILPGVDRELLPSLVHPRSWISGSARIGAGTVVLAGAVINTQARIGDGAIINSHATVEHDCVLGRAVHVSPGATLSGGVRVGDSAWIAAGAVVIPGCVIGSGAVVGAGAVVIRSVAEYVTVVGSPAHPIRRALQMLPVDVGLRQIAHAP